MNQQARSLLKHLYFVLVIVILVPGHNDALQVPNRRAEFSILSTPVLDTTVDRLEDNRNVNSTRLQNIERRSISNQPVSRHRERPIVLPLDDKNIWPIRILALCWGVTFLSALDRVAMSVAILPLSREFEFTEIMKGQVSAVFSVGYGLTILPVGIVLSRTSPRLIMGMGIGIWSLATLATPLTANNIDSITSLLIARAAVGAAESVVLPSLQRILSAWIPQDQKSVATAIVTSGFHAGTISAYFISPLIIAQSGWRGMFFIFGVIGLAYTVPWLIFASDLPTHESERVKASTAIADSSKANDVLLADADHLGLDSLKTELLSKTTFEEAPLREMLVSRGVQGTLIAHAANNWGSYMILAWAPTFYAEQYGLNVKESAFLAVLPAIAGAVGGMVAGFAADAWIRNDQNDSVEKLTRIRKVFQSIALYGPAAFLVILSYHIPEDPLVAQLLLMGVIGLQAFNTAGYGPATQEKAGIQWSGLLYSVTSLPGVMVGSLGVFATGRILEESSHDWGLVFAINAMVNVIGATAFVSMYNATKEFD